MSDTIFFKAKLKRTREPFEVFEKLEKKINKKKGPTCNWECKYDYDDESITIDFHDNKSEVFYFKLDSKKEYSGFCKVYFNLDENAFEASGELKALLDVFYSLKNNFSLIEFTDDYGLAADYWDSKRFKFEYRELTVDEYKRVERLYAEGYTKHEELLRAIMAEDMEMPYEEFVDYENPDISSGGLKGSVQNALSTYVYETSEFRKEGRVCDSLEYFSGDPDKYTFALWGFVVGIAWIFCDGSGKQDEITLEKHRCMFPNLSQIDLIYREKFAPFFIREEDAFKRCVLAYRYFLSVYDFSGFKYAGHKKIRLVIDEVLEKFGGEKGIVYLTCYITSKRYIFENTNKKVYKDNFIRNVAERYGEGFFENYIEEFKNKYEKNFRFQMEANYYAETKLRYVDDSLVL